MKTLLAKAALAVTALVLLLPSSTKAQDGNKDGCSLATLHGEYGFTISGQIIGGPAPGPVNGVALTTFDGHGGLIQTDFVVKSGAPRGTARCFSNRRKRYVLGELGLYRYGHDSFSWRDASAGDCSDVRSCKSRAGNPDRRLSPVRGCRNCHHDPDGRADHQRGHKD